VTSVRTAGPIRVGIVGAGFIGQIHSRMLRRISDRLDGSVRVVAIADRKPEAAQNLAARWPGARAVETTDEIIADELVDAIWICTPTAMHRDACIAAARAGKHIFCEKPLAMSAAEATGMAEAVRTAGVLSQVGLVLRFSPICTVIRAMISEESAGPVIAVSMRDDQHFPTQGMHSSSWRGNPALTAGGALIEHSVHDFDLLRWIFGPLQRLYCQTRNRNGTAGIEDFGAILFEFAAGFHGQLSSTWHQMIGRSSNRRMEVIAENLFIASDFDATGSLIVQRGTEAGEQVISESEVMARFAQIILSERPYLAPFEDSLAIPYALEDAAFIAALRGQCDVNPDLEEGIKAQQLVECAYLSAANGTAVDVDI
jgi:predicted dehydrogenase